MKVYSFKLKLGEQYNIHTHYGLIQGCTFIKSTPKGYNFIHDDRSQVIFKRKHFYSREFSNRKIPKQVKGDEIVITCTCIKAVWYYDSSKNKRNSYLLYLNRELPNGIAEGGYKK